MSDEQYPQSYTYQKKSSKKPFIVIGFFILVLFGALFGFRIFSPRYLPDTKIITISEGFSFQQAADKLQQEGVIHSSFAAQILARIEELSVKAGTYEFEEGAQYLTTVLGRLAKGDYGDVYTRITIPEGSTNKEIREIFRKKIPSFDSDFFDKETKDKEGYLFPDTYFFLPDVSTQEIISTLLTNFDAKTEALGLSTTKRRKEDIITMASIIEREAGPSFEEQQMVSGILWKRLDEGMLLQVDAPFVYILGKGSSELRISDLRNDGPYNTYTRKGLTPTPIGNPGVSALKAALNPKTSPYYFYLHDFDGNIHYGVDHDDHVNNKQRYLR
jgi:UPF0755 protein